MKNIKEKIPSISSWVSAFNIQTFKWRLHWLKPTDPKKWLINVIRFYRSYEPSWLAKITDRSFAYQLVIDETIDNFLKKNKVKIEKGYWCDPGLSTGYTFFLKSTDWTDQEKVDFERDLKNEIYNVYGLSSSWAWNSHCLYFATKYGNGSWQSHFCDNIISQIFNNDYVEYTTKARYKRVYAEGVE